MNPAYLSPLANHLWQSSLFAGTAALLTLALGNNCARVRHWVWLLASWKFLIPFSVLISLGGQIHWRTAPQTTQSSLSVVIDEVSQPFMITAAPPVSMSAERSATSPIPAVLWTIWACGFLSISCSWWIRWRRIRAAVRGGSPVYLEVPITAVSSPTLLEPGIFGVFRPVILLPEGILNRLTAAQLKGVIAHELCHVYHRDNLMAAIHMFVETVFWFHPLVWWIGKRMVEERERACDEEVLRLGNEPRGYAEAILTVCKAYVESPVICVSGVGGANLRKRIAAIMSRRAIHRLSFRKKAALAATGAASLLLPIAIGMQSQLVDPQSRSGLASSATIRPTFEVAAIKTCKEAGGPIRSREGAGSQIVSPGVMDLPCQSVRSLIQIAYVRADFRANGGTTSLQLQGGPSWIDSERYQITAKAQNAVGVRVMEGPMLQALLEERFHLKTHRETREAQVYALTVAKGGLKIKPAKPGGCIPKDPDEEPPVSANPRERPFCGDLTVSMGMRRIKYDVAGGSIRQLAQNLGAARLDRPAIDRTGITETFDFHLEFAPEGADLSGENTPPSIFSVLAGLGLKLEPARGPRELLLIDHVEKPSEN